jgi:hypothetical protein
VRKLRPNFFSRGAKIARYGDAYATVRDHYLRQQNY